jgi:hypothetical protein
MMRKITLAVLLAVIVFAGGCNRDNEEDLYYEPLVDGFYNIEVDESQKVNFTIEPGKPVSLTGTFDNGINFTLEFGAEALIDYQKVEASVQPISGFREMPAGLEFQFGYVFSPEGTQFNNPGKMILEIPSSVEVEGFKGLYFEGGTPENGSETEIWSVRLIPLMYRTVSGKHYVEFELHDFSGFAGVTGGDFKCGNPVAAESCDELNEILACYLQDHEIGWNEEITGEDLKKINGALRDYLDAGLKWIEAHPSDIDEDWEVENALRDVICWKATALMYNSTLDHFDDLLNRVADLFTKVIVDKLTELDSDCSAMTETDDQALSFWLNSSYLILARNMSDAGLLDREVGIDPFNYCNEIALNYYTDPFLDTTEIYISPGYPVGFEINFPPELHPAVSRSLGFTVYATNLLGEPEALALREDYDISIIHLEGLVLEGTVLKEVIATCGNAETGYYPCYAGAYAYLAVTLKSSSQGMNIIVKRLP